MKKLLSQIILLANYDISWSDRLKYITNILIHLAPVVFILDLANWWWNGSDWKDATGTIV